MTGARHKTDQNFGNSDMPSSYGPSIRSLVARAKSTACSRQEGTSSSGFRISNEPRPEKELNFN